VLLGLIGLEARLVGFVSGVARRIAKCFFELHLRFDYCRPTAMPPHFNDEWLLCMSQ
jgi:hypothetical protein